jgi:hypothetical protein
MEKGIELNMNLASAFGIEALPSDSTNVPRAPVTIRIKDWPAYRKEQVVAATLHCLLRSVRAPPKSPLKILIEATRRKLYQQVSWTERHFENFSFNFFVIPAWTRS